MCSMLFEVLKFDVLVCDLCDFVGVLWVKYVVGNVVVIVEIKKVSLLKGVLCEYFVLVDIVCLYVVYGVVCLLVLIDEQFFQGGVCYFEEVCVVCLLLVLCKDFIVDVYQIVEVCVMGVDVILLIVVVFDMLLMQDFEVYVYLFGFVVLVEVYDCYEMEQVLMLKMLLFGINNCNLCMFEMLIQIMFDMFDMILVDCIVVIEFGILLCIDVDMMCVVNVNMFFVGEVFMCVDQLGEEFVWMFF